MPTREKVEKKKNSIGSKYFKSFFVLAHERLLTLQGLGLLLVFCFFFFMLIDIGPYLQHLYFVWKLYRNINLDFWYNQSLFLHLKESCWLFVLSATSMLLFTLTDLEPIFPQFLYFSLLSRSPVLMMPPAPLLQNLRLSSIQNKDPQLQVLPSGRNSIRKGDCSRLRCPRKPHDAFRELNFQQVIYW